MICLFFGSFNPIHSGHVALAQYALQHLPVAELWLMLSPLNPHKEAKDQLPYALRRDLILDATRAHPALKLCELERYMPHPLYTWRTVRALRLLYPGQQFALLIGADNLLNISSWYRYRELLDLVELYVYPRPGYPISREEIASEISYHYCADAPQSTLSSTIIRQSVQQALIQTLAESTQI